MRTLIMATIVASTLLLQAAPASASCTNELVYDYERQICVVICIEDDERSCRYPTTSWYCGSGVCAIA